jgi:hypothetical protein
MITIPALHDFKFRTFIHERSRLAFGHYRSGAFIIVQDRSLSIIIVHDRPLSYFFLLILFNKKDLYLYKNGISFSKVSF